MLYFLQGTSNKISVTLTENVTIANPYFLLELICDQTNLSYFCLLGTNISNDLGRYDAFLVTETSTPDNLDAEITLVQKGFYHYNIYQLSSASLTPSNVILERGKAIVKYSTPTDTYYNGKTTFNNIDS